MTPDRLYDDIINRLRQPLDHQLFERFAVDFLRDCPERYGAALIPGGSDGGMDATVADGKGEPYPVIVTTSDRVPENFRRNLERYIETGGPRHECIVVTSVSPTAQKIQKLYDHARELEFTLIQVYAQNEIASYLYRDARWRKDLLGLPGYPTAVSKRPPTNQPFVDHDLIGREEAMDWLQTTQGDRLLVGESGAGKTSLLYQLSKDEEQAAWFVVDKHKGEIANAIRGKRPQILMLDGAYSDQEFVEEMLRLRHHEEIEGDFSFIVTCSNDERENVEAILRTPSKSTYKLRRLTEDQMVQVIRQAGIANNIWQINSIVRMAAGLPKLAVDLTKSALQEGVEKTHSAETLSTAMQQFYKDIIGRPAQKILACFSLGGNSGMHKETVSEILNMTPLDLHETLVGLEARGVVTGVPNNLDHIKVRPDALRHALISDIFFAGASSMPQSLRDSLIEETPNPKDTALALIGAKARGGKLPASYLEDYISRLETKLWDEYQQTLSSLPLKWKEEFSASRSAWLAYEKIHSIWEEYAWLGRNEAIWVIDNFGGKISLLAQPLLQHIPQRTIPKLLAEAIHDQRDNLHSLPDHPLRQLQDWVKRASPLRPEAVERRAAILRGAKRWLTRGNDPDTGYTAILYAMIPYFEIFVPDPGRGNTMQYYSGCLTEHQLPELQRFWGEIIGCTKVIDVPDPRIFLPTIHAWLYPGHQYSEETYKVLNSSAIEMALNIRDVASEDRRALRSLKQLVQGTSADLEIELDDEIEILYPTEEESTDWEKLEATWKQDADTLANEWIKREPGEVVRQLEPIELTLSQEWPRLTPYLCLRLAAMTQDPLAWFEAILQTSLPADTVMPFLREMIEQEISGWKLALQVSFGTERLRGIALRFILTIENVPKDLEQAALDIAGQYTTVVERLLRSGRLPQETVIKLFQHKDKALVGKLAIAGRPRGENSTMAGNIRPLWETAIIEYCEDDYWLGVIFKAETELGLRWLKRKLSDDSFKRSDYRRSTESVLAGLTLNERRDLLGIVPDEYLYNDMIAGIVGDNPELYVLLLQQSYREKSALLSPLHRSLDSVWEAFAKIAYEHDHSFEEIIACTFARSGSGFSWVGKYSDVWKNRCKQFQDLKNHDDEIIRQIAAVGYQKSLENYEYWKRREDDEDVYGRGWN